jgi:hypothetical protein
VRDAEVNRKMKEENEGVCRTLHVHRNGFQNGVESLIAHEPWISAVGGAFGCKALIKASVHLSSLFVSRFQLTVKRCYLTTICRAVLALLAKCRIASAQTTVVHPGGLDT